MRCAIKALGWVLESFDHDTSLERVSLPSSLHLKSIISAVGLWLCQYGFFNQLGTLTESRMHMEEDGHLFVLPLTSCFFEVMELFSRLQGIL